MSDRTLLPLCLILVLTTLLCPKSGHFQELVDTERCFQTDSGKASGKIFSRCFPYLTWPYTYTLPVSYASINSQLELLDMAGQVTGVNEECLQTLEAYICNYIYIPCDGNDTSAIGICQRDCINYLLRNNSCTNEINFLLILAAPNDFPIMRQCNNTLYILDYYGDNNYTASNECVSISDLLAQLQTESENSGIKQIIIIAIALSVLFGTAVIMSLCSGLSSLAIRRSRRQKKFIRRKSTTTQIELVPHSNEEEQLFKISVDDIQCNCRLSKALVSFHCLEILEEIGHGAFGSVFKGRYSPPNSENVQEPTIDVAVKTIKNSSASYSELKGFLEESAIMCGFNHPHVLGLIAISLDPSNSPHLLLPFMENGDLRSYLKSKRNSNSSRINNYPRGLRYETLRRMCHDIARGMAYLSASRLVHRDLAARNCMIDKTLRVRVADFGLTRDIYETDYYRQSQLGRVPVKWMAPESLHDRISDEKTDVWSYGVTCWEVFSLGRVPYPTISNADMLIYLEQGGRLKKPYLCSDAMYELMIKCWDQEPPKRPNFSNICTSMEVMPPSSGQQQSDNSTSRSLFQDFSFFSSGRALSSGRSFGCSTGQNAYLTLAVSGTNQAFDASSTQSSNNLVPGTRKHTASGKHAAASSTVSRELRNKSLHKIVESTSFLND